MIQYRVQYPLVKLNLIISRETSVFITDKSLSCLFNFHWTSGVVNTFANMQMSGVLFLLCEHFYFQKIILKKPGAYSKHVHSVSKTSSVHSKTL